METPEPWQPNCFPTLVKLKTHHLGLTRLWRTHEHQRGLQTQRWDPKLGQDQHGLLVPILPKPFFRQGSLRELVDPHRLAVALTQCKEPDGVGIAGILREVLQVTYCDSVDKCALMADQHGRRRFINDPATFIQGLLKSRREVFDQEIALHPLNANEVGSVRVCCARRALQRIRHAYGFHEQIPFQQPQQLQLQLQLVSTFTVRNLTCPPSSINS